MDAKFIANAIIKWVHLSSAGVVVGGLLYLRFILLPALTALPEEQRASVWKAAYRKSLRWQMIAFAVLILTGGHNISNALRSMGAAPPEKVSLYWGIFWAKVVLVGTAFVLVHFLVISAPPFRRIQENYRTWLGALVVTTLLVVLLSGMLTLTRLSLIPTR